MTLDRSRRAVIVAALDELTAAEAGPQVAVAAAEIRRLLRTEAPALSAVRGVALAGFASLEASGPAKRAFQHFLEALADLGDHAPPPRALA